MQSGTILVNNKKGWPVLRDRIYINSNIYIYILVQASQAGYIQAKDKFYLVIYETFHTLASEIVEFTTTYIVYTLRRR